MAAKYTKNELSFRAKRIFSMKEECNEEDKVLHKANEWVNCELKRATGQDSRAAEKSKPTTNKLWTKCAP